jgi:hypothetical protein
MPIPDNQIDYRYFGPGAKRRQRDANTRHHAKQSRPKLTRNRLSSYESEIDDSEINRGEPRDARSRVIMLALKYERIDDAYRVHESEIGSHLSRLTFSSIFSEARRAFKVFDKIGVIDQSALKRFRRDK